MDKNEMIHTITIQYFVIYTSSIFATILFCHIDQSQIKMLSVSYLGEVAVFSFLFLPAFLQLSIILSLKVY